MCVLLASREGLPSSSLLPHLTALQAGRRAGRWEGRTPPLPPQPRKDGGCAEPGPQQHLSLQVPSNRNVKVRFKAFFLQEPNVPVGSCTKDYVEINGEK